MAATPVRASYAYTVTDTEGRPIAGASITVYDVGTTDEISETIYADATGASELDNPFTADSLGQFRFYLDKSKRVDLYVSATGYTAYTLQDVDVVRTGEDPAWIVVAANDAPDWQKLGAHYVCDGTDDDEEIQAALDAGGPVKLTRGLFRPGSKVSADDDALLEGCGYLTIVKASDTFTDDRVIENENWGTGSGSDNHNITVRGMKVDGNGKCDADGVIGFKSGDDANRSTNITFRDLWITGGLGHGLHVAGVTGLTIDNVLSEANGDASGDHNVYLLRCTNLQVGPLFVKDSNAGASYGLKLSTCVQGIVDVIATGNNEDGVGIVGSCKDLQIRAICQGNGANGVLVTVDGTTPTDIDIWAICRGNTHHGLSTHSTSARITIRGQYSAQLTASRDGVHVDGDNHVIKGVIAHGNKRSGIYLDSTAQNCTVEGNDVTGNDGENLTNNGAGNKCENNIGSHVDGLIPEPGDAGAIPVTLSGWVALVSGAANGGETRTLADGDVPGLTLDLFFRTDGGKDIVITVASPVNQAGNTELTFDTVGEHIRLASIKDGADIEWRVVANDGVGLGP